MEVRVLSCPLLKTMKVSVIIRTKNEGEIFKKVLEVLRGQTFQDFEVVIVDDNSYDGTDLLVSEFFPAGRYRLIKIPLGEFSHPYSCNLGAADSQGDYLVYINGHSIPVSASWLADGLKNFKDKRIAGVFAYTLARLDANNIECILYNSYTKFFHSKRKEYFSARMGLLGTTNAIIRKDLWTQYRFDESYKMGGEDRDWGAYWTKRGYSVVQDPAFRTFHSHNLSITGLVRQYFKWLLKHKSHKHIQ